MYKSRDCRSWSLRIKADQLNHQDVDACGSIFAFLAASAFQTTNVSSITKDTTDHHHHSISLCRLARRRSSQYYELAAAFPRRSHELRRQWKPRKSTDTGSLQVCLSEEKPLLFLRWLIRSVSVPVKFCSSASIIFKA